MTRTSFVLGLAAILLVLGCGQEKGSSGTDVSSSGTPGTNPSPPPATPADSFSARLKAAAQQNTAITGKYFRPVGANYRILRGEVNLESDFFDFVAEAQALIAEAEAGASTTADAEALLPIAITVDLARRLVAAPPNAQSTAASNFQFLSGLADLDGRELAAVCGSPDESLFPCSSFVLKLESDNDLDGLAAFARLAHSLYSVLTVAREELGKQRVFDPLGNTARIRGKLSSFVPAGRRAAQAAGLSLRFE